MDTEMLPKAAARGSRNGTSAGINAGGAVVLIIITVLCICIFGVLSFVSAFSDRKLAQITRDAAAMYYEAEKTMEADLAVLDEALAQADGGEPGDILSAAAERLTDAQPSVLEDGTPVIVNTVKYGENRMLTAVIAVYAERDGAYDLDILSWRSSPVEIPEYGQEEDLWDGES